MNPPRLAISRRSVSLMSRRHFDQTFLASLILRSITAITAPEPIEYGTPVR
jgi:hypothetical protein